MRQFDKYLATTDLSEAEKSLLKKRMGMQDKVGNNQYYQGNGLTRDKIAGSGNHYGAVETLNFERQPVNLQQLEEAGAISYVSRLLVITCKKTDSLSRKLVTLLEVRMEQLLVE